MPGEYVSVNTHFPIHRGALACVLHSIETLTLERIPGNAAVHDVIPGKFRAHSGETLVL